MQELMTFLSHHPILGISAVVLFILLVMIELLRAKRNNVGLSTAQAVQKINHDNAVVIDIRPTDSYRKGHIIDATNIPAAELNGKTKKLEKYRTKPIILACEAGVESQKIAALLLKQGYNAYSLTGGIRAWNQADLPLVKE